MNSERKQTLESIASHKRSHSLSAGKEVLSKNPNARTSSITRLAHNLTRKSSSIWLGDNEKLCFDGMTDGDPVINPYPHISESLELDSARGTGINDLSPTGRNDLIHLDVNFVWRKEFCSVFYQVLFQGTMGAVIFQLQLGTLLLVTVLTGHIEPANICVSAAGIGIAYLAIFSSAQWGLNSGFNVICSRCIAAKNYKMLRKYIWRQHMLVNIYLQITFAFLGGLYPLYGWQYAKEPELLDYNRSFQICVIPTVIAMYNMDVLRELHLSLSMYISAILIELFNTAITITCVYVAAFPLDFGFNGLILGIGIGQSCGYIPYIFNFFFNSSFKPYHQKSNLTDKEVNESLNPVDAEEADDQMRKTMELSSFDNFWYYLSFCLHFALMFFLENCWLRLDTIIASFLVDTQKMAALTAFYNVTTMFESFGFGFGFATTSIQTQYLVAGQVKKGKAVAFISFLAVIVVSTAFAIPIGIFSQDIANYLILEGEANEILRSLLVMYTFIQPLQLILVVLYSINKALGKQQYHIIAQILSEYAFHFISLFILWYYTELGVKCFIINLAFTYVAIILCTATVAFGANWTVEVVKIRKDMFLASNSRRISKIEIATPVKPNSRITVSNDLENDKAITD